jgi:hypothetical protein
VSIRLTSPTSTASSSNKSILSPHLVRGDILASDNTSLGRQCQSTTTTPMLLQSKASSYLSEQISERPSHKRSHGLGEQRLLVKSVIVGGPAGDSSSAKDGRIAKERAGGRRSLLKGRGLDSLDLLGEGSVRADSECTNGKRKGQQEGGSELHLQIGRTNEE